MRKKYLFHSFCLVGLMISLLFFLLSIPGFAETNKTNTGLPDLKIQQSDENSLDIRMTIQGFSINERKENSRTYTVLGIGDYNGDLKPGYPNLPTIRQYIYIPDGQTARVTVNPGAAVTYEKHLVYPVQQPQANLKGAVDPPFCMDDSVYDSDRLFPSEQVYIDKSERIRGHNIALLHICPFRYNPAKKVLTAYPDMQVRVIFEGEKKQVSSRMQSSGFDSFIRGIVLNPGAISKSGQNLKSFQADEAELLIITAPGFETAANTLRNHKIGMGTGAVVKTTAETGATAAEIRNFIQNAYDTWTTAPTYILILGDAELIPANYMSIHPYDGGLTATDLYYACVDGDDFQPDIFIGRVSVDTLAEAQNAVQKIIDYETNPPTLPSFYSNMAFAAYFQDYYDPGYEDRRFIRSSEEARDFLLKQGYNIERIYNRTLEYSVQPTNYNKGYYGNGEPLPPDLLTPNGFSWDGDSNHIISSVNSGVFLLIHRDHGMDRNGGYSHTGWGDPYFDETHIEALNNGNLLPVVMSLNCETGWFDGAQESFCELFVRKSNGGAIAAFGASRVGYSGYTDFLDLGFLDCVWPDFLPAVPNNPGGDNRLGAMLNHGKIAMDLLWGDPWGLRKTQYEIFNLLGDPSLRMWTKQPGTSGTGTILIQSDPLVGVPISVDQPDINGNSDGNAIFTRTYANGAQVTLTAPASFEGRNFVKWGINGVEFTVRNIQVTIDTFCRATAYYSITKTLNVQSYPAESIPIIVTPTDSEGSGNGNSNFTRLYSPLTDVTLTAPEGFNGRYFVRWLVDGTPVETRTIHVNMDNDHTAIAEYTFISTDCRILIIDPVKLSGIAIKNAVEANGFKTNYMTTFPARLEPGFYPAVFVCLGIYGQNHILTASEGDILKEYLDKGGNLYIESGETWAYDPQTVVYPYFGIKGLYDGEDWADIFSIHGMPGTFTSEFNFDYLADSYYIDWIDVADGVTDAYVIWSNHYTPDSVTPYYLNGVARNTKTFKTIGVSFEFYGISPNLQNAVMKTYMDFFTNTKKPVITVTSPNGGESLTPGTFHNITWNAANIKGEFKITLWKDSQPVGTLAEWIENSRSSYTWRTATYVGGTASPGSGYVIKVEEEETGVSDLSDAAFSISAAPSVNIISPNGRENLTRGDVHTISWETTIISGTLKISLWKNGALLGTIADEIDPALKSYLWTIGNYIGGSAGAGTGYTVKIEKIGTVISDSSDAAFTILELPFITVGAPNGGETLPVGTSTVITWSPVNVKGTFKISLWKDDAPVGTIAEGIDESRRSYSWNVGNYTGGSVSPGPGYKIKLEAGMSGVSDSSDASFTISDPHPLDITSPNGGENLQIGAVLDITWTSSNLTGVLKITLWKENTQVGVIADNLNPAAGKFTWTVGNYEGGTASPGTGYKVKIKEAGSLNSDTSDNPFTLLKSASISISTPNGGETFTLRDARHISWSASGVKGNLKITLWKDGAQVGVIAEGIDNSRTTIPWTAGQYTGGVVSESAGYKIKIEEEGASVSDMSDTPFTILEPPSITVLTPNEKELLSLDSPYRITWKSIHITGKLKITLWEYDYQFGVIADNIDPGQTSYQWTVGSYTGGKAYPGEGYKVKIEDTGAPSVSDMSDTGFEIDDLPRIWVEYPRNDERLIIGQTVSISWWMHLITGRLKVTLWKDDTLLGVIADDLEPGTTSYLWTVGNYVGGTATEGYGYKIKIEEKDSTVSGMSGYPFYLLGPRSITVTSPNGGEILTRGATHTITWDSSNVTGTLYIYLYKNDSYYGTIASVHPAVKSYPWIVGNLMYSRVATGDPGYKIRVWEYGSNVSDWSDAPFTIYQDPSITVLAPNGGETFVPGSTIFITWNRANITGKIKITLWKDDAYVGDIANNIDPLTAMYEWIVGKYSGGVATSGTGYKVKVEQEGTEISDISDAPFTISDPPSITVTSPNGGENWQLSSYHTITWDSLNMNGDVRITLWKDSSIVGTIAYIYGTVNSYDWAVGKLADIGMISAGSGYKVMVEGIGTTTFDFSDTPFTITDAPTIQLTSPLGGENLPIRSIKPITWTCSNVPGTLKISLINDEKIVGVIADNIDPTSGVYEWQVGNYSGGVAPKGPGYFLKIEANGTSTCAYNVSAFSIVNASLSQNN